MKKSNKQQLTLPSQTIGIIGGGQLGRMMAIAAKQMGYYIAVLDPTPNGPTAQVADKQIVAQYDDMDAIKELTEISDIVTYEFENVDVEAATYIEQQGKLPQGAYALEVTQNRKKEKQLIDQLALPVAPFFIVEDRQACQEALEKIAYPLVIKTCRGGYDGKGQLKLNSKDEMAEGINFVEEEGTCIVEQWIPFDKEISVVFTRSQTGEITFFPIAENEHKDHILYKTIVPANISQTVEDKAIQAAKQIAEEMNIIGTFAIELFVKNEAIYINEMAPRPHNSGHYTIEACNVSQFSQHIRAICGLPLAEVEQLNEAMMINVLGEDMPRALAAFNELAEASVHLYGKEEAKAKRKMGHVTFTAKNYGELLNLVQSYEEDLW